LREEQKATFALEAEKQAEPFLNDADNTSDSDPEDDPAEKALLGIRKNSIAVVDLKTLSLEDDQVAEILSNLINNASVTTLLLDGNDLEVKSFIQLNELLLKNNNITHLSLNFVMLGEHGSHTITNGLALNHSVTILQVSGNDLFENGMAALGVGLKQNTVITTINLKENSISDAGCKYLADIMSINSTISNLDISNNYINKEGAPYLAEMLLNNSSLRSLNLERNSLEDEGCQAVAVALLSNSTLEELYLGNNIIETMGTCALAEALLSNDSLKLVDLRQNIFDIDSEIALLEVLIKKKGKLTILWKSPPSKNDIPPGRADLQAIIDYFTPDMILDVYKNNESLEPLVDLELVLTHIRYSQSEAQKMWDIVFSDKTVGFRYPLDLLIRIVKHQVAEASPNREYCKLYAANMDRICAVLKPEPSDKSLLFSKLQLFQLTKYITKMDEPHVSSCIIKTSLLTSITELFFKFTNNSIFLSEFVDFFDHLLTSTSPSTFTLLTHLLVQAGFLERLLKVYLEESRQTIPRRTGNFGHMTKIANKINEVATKNKKLEKLLEGYPEWSQTVTALEKVNNVIKIPVDLKPPEVGKDKKLPAEFDDSLM